MGLLAMKNVWSGFECARVPFRICTGGSYFVILSFAPTVGHDYTYFSLNVLV